MDYRMFDRAPCKDGSMRLIDFLYSAFESIGYDHPLLAHVPIGIIVGLLVVAFIAVVLRRRTLVQSAHYPFVVIAFIAVFPLALLGFTDWQHFYEGVWLLPIKIKLVLTGVLLVLLAAGVLLSRKGDGATKTLLTSYVLCLLTMGGLGYFGAELIFGTSAERAVPKLFVAGSKIFDAQCGSCHANVTELSNSRQTASFAVFIAFLRKPSGPARIIRASPLQRSGHAAVSFHHTLSVYARNPHGGR